MTTHKSFIVALAVCILSAVVSLTSCNKEEEDTPTLTEHVIDDARITKSYHDDKNKATIFNIEYLSQDPYGNATTLSGVFIISDEVTDKHLRGTLLYNRYTIYGEDECPSRGNVSIEVKAAGSKTVIVVADGYGFGCTTDKNQPYCISRANAQASVDAFLTVRDILKRNGYTLDEPLFNIGYSQGGQTAIGVLRLCTEKYPDIRITHTIAGGGPYDMGETYRSLIARNTTTMPSTVISSFVAYNEFYGINASYSDMFTEPTLSRIEPYLLSKKYTINKLNNILTDSYTLSDWMTPAMRDFDSELAKKFMAAFESDNLATGWTPHSDERITLVQSTADDCVPVENTEKLVAFLQANGLNIITTNSDAKYTPGTVFVYKKDFGSSFGGPHYAAGVSFITEVVDAIQHYLNIKGIWFKIDLNEFF